MSQLRDAQGRFTARDGLVNLASGAGTSVDKRSYAYYTRPFILPEQIEAAYRSSWMMKKAIDLPAKDMTRKKRAWQLDEDDVDLIEKEEKRLKLWEKVRQALILGRLGGGLIVMGVGREDPTTPLGDAVRPAGSLRYLHVMNRWQVSLGPIVMDPTDDLFGQPSYFQLNYGIGSSSQLKMHPSRIIAFRGEPAPNLRGTTGADDWFWGDPLVLSIADAVRNADAAMNGFASLIEEAKLDTVTIPGLTQLVATTEGEALVTKRVQVANQIKSTHNTRILDGGRSKDQPGETWETRQITWAGMPDIIRVYAAVVASAADIPATRFLGKAPDGMNATGDGDESNYTAKIEGDQDDKLRPALDQIDAVLLPSAGVTLAEDEAANYDFPPLKQMSELDEATLFDKTMDALTKLKATGTVPAIAFDKAMQHTAVERGWMEGLDGALEEVPEADRFPSESMPAPGDVVPGAIDPLTGKPKVPAAGAPMRRAANDARFRDAAPRSLYVSRKLLNAADLIRWAKKEGFETTTPAAEMHVTIAFSRTPVDWMKIGSEWSGDRDGTLLVSPGGPRLVERLGDKGAVVLMFGSPDLSWRHESIKEAGASFDFSEYQPHVTITYQAPAGLDLAKVKPYTGPLRFGPELFAEVVDDWEQGIDEQ